MEIPVEKEDHSVPADSEHVKEVKSVEKFEKFVYELFEQNGVLNDLRAYLRGHIVNVLKSAQTGDPLACQKHFTQRLDLTYQALNVLIAEYLLRLEFSYTMSVFVSEIPLANMVFDFAKTLMLNNDEDFSTLRFKDSDVWSILNYLGVKCDSEHASNIVEMYRSIDTCPLLLCIFKCIPMYNKEPTGLEANSSEESVSSSIKSSDTIEEKSVKGSHRSLHGRDKCKHYTHCQTCQNKVTRVKEKYRKKKKRLAKNVTETKLDPLNVECLMKNINAMERSLINEMFEQLKSVYEAEVQMVKEEEQKKVKRSLASHALQLQKRREEIEESLRSREEELEVAVQHRKRFLWELARGLRDQHRRMTRAMQDVQQETHRLAAKENSLKTQLAEAEEILKQRGEEMRLHITSELATLEQHLESMKTERENINRERIELKSLKVSHDITPRMKEHNTEHEELKSHYDLLKNELSILRKYLESMSIQPKCVIERSTMTELHDVTLNNAQDVDYSKHDDDKLRSAQVVNDLKKQKNVNFSQSSAVDLRGESSDEDARLLRQLHEENQRLSAIAAQQSADICKLRCEQAELRAHVCVAHAHAATPPAHSTPLAPLTPPAHWRPRTAPAVVPPYTYLAHRMNASASAHGVRSVCGAGEELSLFSNAQPRILVPGDHVPFIGVIRDTHDKRRTLRRRNSPVSGIIKPRTVSPLQRDRVTKEKPEPSTSHPIKQSRDDFPNTQKFDTSGPTFEQRHQRPKSPIVVDINKTREKSPNTLLREVKNKLKTKDDTKHSTTSARDKSPNSVLREAKLRLRKLEIEAEAVEKSYLNFRKRQAELRNERTSFSVPADEMLVSKDIDNFEIKRSSSLQKLNENRQKAASQHLDSIHKSTKNDFEKFLKEYQTKYDIGETYFKNKNLAITKTNPIPVSYSEVEEKRLPDNYLETPITEFRKLYYSEKSGPYQRNREINREQNQPNELLTSMESEKSLKSSHDKFEADPNNTTQKQANKTNIDNTIKELEILEQNINKIYDLPDESQDVKIEEDVADECAESNDSSKTEIFEDKNVLRIEVESVSEVNDIKVSESQTQDLMVLVQSPIGVAEVRSQSDSDEKISPQMTIIVSPKRISPKGPNDVESLGSKRSQSPEKAAKLFDAIFRADTENQISSIQMQLELSKEILDDSITESEKGDGGDEYPDDFSADVDNYNSRSEYENSPISMPKTSEDENFWD